MKQVYLVVVKQSGQNNLHRVFAKRPNALKYARSEVKRVAKETGYKLTDRKKYGLAVIYRAATWPYTPRGFAVVEAYEMPVVTS